MPYLVPAPLTEQSLTVAIRVALQGCVIFLIILATTVCVESVSQTSSTVQDNSNRLAPKDAERVIAGRARQVILSLKAGNMVKFSTFVHPQKGVRFSPYADVTDDNRVIKRNQLSQTWSSSKRYKWGSYDATGDPIRLTLRKYHRRSVFDHDYSRAKYVSYNPENMSHGTTPNNIRNVYPKSIAVEYHFSGFDERVSGMDWKSLWLVFEKRGSEWFVVGIVHDEWTT